MRRDLAQPRRVKAMNTCYIYFVQPCSEMLIRDCELNTLRGLQIQSTLLLLFKSQHSSITANVKQQDVETKMCRKQLVHAVRAIAHGRWRHGLPFWWISSLHLYTWQLKVSSAARHHVTWMDLSSVHFNGFALQDPWIWGCFWKEKYWSCRPEVCSKGKESQSSSISGQRNTHPISACFCWADHWIEAMWLDETGRMCCFGSCNPSRSVTWWYKRHWAGWWIICRGPSWNYHWIPRPATGQVICDA